MQVLDLTKCGSLDEVVEALEAEDQPQEVQVLLAGKWFTMKPNEVQRFLEGWY